LPPTKRSRKKEQRPDGEHTTPRGIYLLPNLFTTLNLFGGFYSIIAGINGRWEHAAVAILVSILFDGLDGRVARMTGTTSRFGVEYDSMADLVSFGVAPALLLYNHFLHDMSRLGWLASFLFVACVALRLARFNLQHAKEEKVSFTGLPSPGGAGMAASLTLFEVSGGLGEMRTDWIVLLIAYSLAFLMISTIPFRSLKSFDLKRPRPFQYLVFLLLALVVGAMAFEPVLFFTTLFFLYMVSGPIEYLFSAMRGRRAHQKPHSVEGT
jgi:CDP-diacylglycerol--serine O-phosphatidyltransferase